MSHVTWMRRLKGRRSFAQRARLFPGKWPCVTKRWGLRSEGWVEEKWKNSWLLLWWWISPNKIKHFNGNRHLARNTICAVQQLSPSTSRTFSSLQTTTALPVKQFLSFSPFSQHLANSNLVSASQLTRPGYFMWMGWSTAGRFITASFHFAIRDCRMAGKPQYVTREGDWLGIKTHLNDVADTQCQLPS